MNPRRPRGFSDRYLRRRLASAAGPPRRPRGSSDRYLVGPGTQADFNGDGVEDSFDVHAFLAAFNRGC